MRVVVSAVIVLMLGFVALAKPEPFQGQQRLVKVTGVTLDPSGATLPGTTVELLRAGRVIQKTTSNQQGEFVFTGVPAGEYQVRAMLPGFNQALAPLTVADIDPARMTLTLQVGSMMDTVTVAAEPMRASLAPPRPGAPTMSQLRVVAGMAGNARRQFNTEAYDRIDENGYRRVADQPLSTFSVDVDTASYANVRRFLSDGAMPPADAVRIEELINYFHFAYPAPREGEPFSVTTEVTTAPWNPKHRLALVGLQTRPLAQGRTPPRNLVFLLDVSGSMDEPDKLPLVQTAMRMLTQTLTAQDRVAIVVYAGASGLALPSTSGDRKSAIEGAIESLRAGGSTNGADGIRLAYDTAAKHFVKDGINRVILATDGDFNVGVTNQGDLTRLIEQERGRGIFLSVLGVGTGNLKDSTMEKLADRGNGNYAYLDSVMEARRVLVAQAGATLVTVAKDVKIQVEFNPKTVGAYRLIGYENRLLATEDFNNDKKDAGDVGAGHAVTALYEIVPPGEDLDTPGVDPLKYQRPAAATGAASGELMTVKLRYKAPESDTSKLMSIAVQNRASDPSSNLGFAAAVAEFGFMLRNSEHRGETTWASARTLAQRHRGDDPDGYRAELVRLIDLASALGRSEKTDGVTRR